MEKDARKPHIVMYIGSLQRGGAERVMTNLAMYFDSIGYQVTFVTTYLYPDEYPVERAAWKVTGIPGPIGEHGAITPLQEQGEGIHRILSALTEEETGKNRLLNVWKRTQKLQRIFRELQPDVILSFLGKNNVMAIQCAKGLGIPVIVSVRSNPAREYAEARLNRSMKALFPKAARVVLQTTQAVSYFPANIQKKAVVLPNSVNPDFIRPIVPFEERRKEVVSVGRLDENKNQGLLIRAFARAASKEAASGWTLSLYGDGPSRETFTELAKSLGIWDRVTFHGNVTGIADRIADAGLFVLPSIQEGMPNALLEAMALGIPSISTDYLGGGPRDILEDGSNGFLVPSQDEETMAQRMLQLMQDSELARTFSLAGSELVQTTYSPDVINAKWRACMEEVIEE